MAKIQGELLRGNIDTIILKCLFEGDKYGNEIVQAITDRTEGQFEIKQPTLYSSLTRLENQGLATCTWVTTQAGGRRKYFSITDAGREYFSQKQEEWEFSRTVVDRLISEHIFDLEYHRPDYRARPEGESIADDGADIVAETVVPAEPPAEEPVAEDDAIVVRDDPDDDIVIEVTPEPSVAETAEEPVVEAVEEPSEAETIVEPPAETETAETSAAETAEEPVAETVEESSENETIVEPPAETAEPTGQPVEERVAEPPEEHVAPADDGLTDAEIEERVRALRENSDSYADAVAAEDEAAAAVTCEIPETPVAEPVEEAEQPEEEPEPIEEPEEAEQPEEAPVAAEAASEPAAPEPAAEPTGDEEVITIRTEEEARAYTTARSVLYADPEPAAPRRREEDDDVITVTTRDDARINKSVSGGITYRRHDRELSRAYNAKYYVYSNRLRAAQYGIIGGIMLIELFIIYMSCTVTGGIRDDSWLYWIGIVAAIAVPAFALVEFYTDRYKTRRIDEDPSKSLLYRFFIVLQCLVLTICVNILVERNVFSETTYLLRLIIPCVLETNFFVSGLLYQLLVRTRAFAVKD